MLPGLPPIQMAFSTQTAVEYVLLVRALYGNDSQIGAIERAGARAWLAVAKRNIVATADNPTGRLSKSMRVYRARSGGFGVAGNRRGDGNYGKSGTGVRYATPHHQGHPNNPATKYYYTPEDPEADVEAAMDAQHDKQWNELVRRAQVLDGKFGPAAEAELRAKLVRAGTKLARGRRIGAPAVTQGGRAAATLKVLESAGTISHIATTGSTLLPSTTLDA